MICLGVLQHIEEVKELEQKEQLSALTSIEERILAIARFDSAAKFREDLNIIINNPPRISETYCDFEQAGCACPKFQGFTQCWSHNCIASVCSCNTDSETFLCGLTLLLPVTIVISLAQLIFEPCMGQSWDTSQAKCNCPKAGCPLTRHAEQGTLDLYLNDLVRQLTSLKDLLENAPPIERMEDDDIGQVSTF